MLNGLKGKLAGVAVAATMLAGASALSAQMSRGFSGNVVAPDGKPLAKAVVTFVNTQDNGKYTIKTNKQGKFAYYTLPMGTFDVYLTPPGGKQELIQKGLHSEFGVTQNFTINLQQQAEVASGTAPPPGMSKAEAAEYEKKAAAAKAETAKVGQLNALLKQNQQFVAAKQYDQAVAVMKQAVAIDQKHDVLFANLADDLDHAKHYNQAAAAYQQAITLKPTDAGYEINLGSVLAKAGKVDAANAAFTKAAAMDPTKAKMAMYNMGVVLLNKGNMQGAEAAFTKLLTIDPNNADAWYYKGICLLGQAQTDPKTQKLIPPPGTAEALKQSIKLAPNGPNAKNAQAALQTIGGGN
jgi:tetratricopeptide (TPR) repeat protein